MNFEEMQLIWDAQSKQRLFAFDQPAMERAIDMQSRVIRLDLKKLELSFVIAALGLAVVATADTFWQRAEFFQLVGAAVGLTAATCVWFGRRRRLAMEAATLGGGLAADIDLSIARTQSMMRLSRIFAVCFSIGIVWGVAVRVAIYGFESNEAKLVLGAVALVFLNGLLHWHRKFVQRPRLDNLKALRAKLEE